MKKTATPRTLALLLASTLVILAGSVARSIAQDGPKDPKAPAPGDATMWITEIDRETDSGQVHILLNVGKDGGVERGDTVEIERDGKKIARATVIASYPDVAMANVDAVLDKGAAVARGDWVRSAGKAKRPATAPEKPITVAATDGGIKLDGADLGFRAGADAMLMRDGKPVGRIKLKAWNNGWEASLVEGDAKVGDRVELVPDEHGTGRENALTPEELKRLRREADPPKGVDFAATGFLGVVAEIEHPVRILAPCHIGVLVRRIAEGSPAERAKIRPGDRVIAIDDRIVRTPGEIYHGVRRRASDAVRVTIAREDVLQTVVADFSKR